MIKKIKNFIKQYGSRKFFNHIINEQLNPDFFFIQIGACDGVSFDPIHHLIKKHNWKGILIEPIPHLFTELQKNYSGYEKNLTFLNVAVSNKNENIFMKTVSKEGLSKLPAWSKGVSAISTLDRNALGEKYWVEGAGSTHHDISYADIEKYTKEVEVTGMTVSSLFERYVGTQKIDLLQIDAEGFDYEIIKQIDFENNSPMIIHFEYSNMTDHEKSEIETILDKNNYKLHFYHKNDALAQLVSLN